MSTLLEGHGMTKIGKTYQTISLRPARIQAAAESEVERQIANLNRVMDISDEEREAMAAAIRSLAEPLRGQSGVSDPEDTAR